MPWVIPRGLGSYEKRHGIRGSESGKDLRLFACGSVGLQGQSVFLRVLAPYNLEASGRRSMHCSLPRSPSMNRVLNCHPSSSLLRRAGWLAFVEQRKLGR